MVRENRPAQPVPREPGPPESMRFEVGSGDNDRECLAHQVGFDSWNDLCRYNWNTQAPFEVNWYLHNHVGCLTPSTDNSTYLFSDQSPRQWIYVRGQSGVAPSHPSARGQCRAGPPTAASRGVRQGQTGTTVTRRCASIDDYIAAVVKAERIFRGEMDTWELITALRMTWAGEAYNDALWALLLPAQWWWADPLDLNRTRGGDRFSDRDRQVLRGRQCLVTRQHGCIDFGHALTGINASCHPATGGFLRSRGLNTAARVVGAATWSGDVGSVYKAYYPYRANARASLDDAWQSLASDEDLLGDVDGVVLGNVVRDRGRTHAFSQSLRQYYGDPSFAQTQIFERFNTLHPTSRAADMIWSFVSASSIPSTTPPREESLLNQLVQRWRNWVDQRRRSQVRNLCEQTRWREANVRFPPLPEPSRRAGGIAADAGPPPAGAGGHSSSSSPDAGPPRADAGVGP